MIGPLVMSFAASTVSWNGLLEHPVYIGIANYSRLVHDPRFWHAVHNSALQICVSTVVIIPLAFVLGFFLSRRPRGYRLLTVIFFTPVITSTAAKAIIFMGLFLPQGMINSILGTVGLSSLEHYWLGDPTTALSTIISLDIWGGIGFYPVLISAALSNVPDELYEAAAIEGASVSRQMIKIALPLITDFMGVVLVLHFLFLLLGSAQNVLLLTQGGPGDYSLTLPYYMYERAFVAQQLGYSQAIATVLFVVGLFGMLAIRAATRRQYQL